MQLTTPIQRNWILLIGLATVGYGGVGVQAVSPEEVTAGRSLFERQWTPSNPVFGGDGLGPLFNGNSCVACHHQGGVGGGGDARFNARTLGIDAMSVSSRPPSGVFAEMVASFHPGFVVGGTNVAGSMSLHHHGGSPLFESKRSALMNQLPSLSDSAGGPRDAAEVRREITTPIPYQTNARGMRMQLQAKVFHRNTTSLFGAGLIDAIPVKAIQQQAQRQQRHGEISGRPATLSNGLIGKFGWRANVATLRQFIDQACANELGLKTPASDQPSDPTAPNYRNPSRDINDQQIDAMRQFVAALPAPVRAPTTSPEQAYRAQQGEQIFASIGCAVCHTPTLGPARGIYSDLLLHDMGRELSDPNAAEPKIVRSKVIHRSMPELTVTMTTTEDSAGHYGNTSRVRLTKGSGSRRGIGFQPSGSPRTSDGRGILAGQSSGPGYYGSGPLLFSSANNPSSRFRFVPIAMLQEWDSETEEIDSESEGRRQVRRITKTRHDLLLRHTVDATPVRQEWRTAPLWGLRDSPPYMHDGRAGTVLEAITLHSGEASGTRHRFLNLSFDQRDAVLGFLDTLVAPPSAPQRLQ